MSYCRFSDMDWACELYCFAHTNGGIAMYVAHSKADVDRTALPSYPDWPQLGASESEAKQWAAQYVEVNNAWLAALESAPRVPIEREYAGDHLRFDSAADALAMLARLRELGYQFPRTVEAAIRQDDADGAFAAD